ncbi:competence protein ComG [Shouchella plakortidis]|uniref:Competence protein ComG n=2 Tax=Alkalicoccobacillus plakortidis TaxID=444060 RepID=A0ABT0XGX3_9BACI|nr:competence protein ComG [Alkalicoccobacillus plakortidis]
MLVVLMIISILLLIAIPNMTKNNEVAGEKGCDATKKLLLGQVSVYEMEEGNAPTSVSDLVEAGYADTATCPNGETLELDDLVFERSS